MKGLFTNIILSGAGATFVLLFLSRLLPNDKLKAASFRAGKFLTGYGRSRLGKSFWEKMETFLENSIAVCWDGLKEGLDSDEEKGNNQ